MTASRVRLAAAAALAAAVGLAAVLLFTGGADGGTGSLSWEGKPRVFESGKPTDRVLTARIENTSLKPIDLDVENVRIVDADGNELKSTARFLEAFAHSLFAWSQRPAKLTEFERRRIGEIVTIKPGQTAPVALSWRVPPGEKPPERVDFGEISVALP